MVLAIGAGVSNYRDDARDRAAAEADPRLRGPLVPPAGRMRFLARHDATNDFDLVNADGSSLTRLTHLPQGSLHSCPPTVSPDRMRLAISVGGVLIVRLDPPGETMQLDRPGGS